MKRSVYSALLFACLVGSAIAADPLVNRAGAVGGLSVNKTIILNVPVSLNGVKSTDVFAYSVMCSVRNASTPPPMRPRQIQDGIYQSGDAAFYPILGNNASNQISVSVSVPASLSAASSVYDCWLMFLPAQQGQQGPQPASLNAGSQWNSVVPPSVVYVTGALK